MNVKLSLAEWSLHRTLEEGKITNLDFPAIAKDVYGFDAVEYVNRFFAGHDDNYLSDLLKRSKDVGVTNHLIMIDYEGNLALPMTRNDSRLSTTIRNGSKLRSSLDVRQCASIFMATVIQMIRRWLLSIHCQGSENSQSR